jgi:hypothetical protein
MSEASTTAVVQRYLEDLTGAAAAEPVVRPLLDRALLRLQRLCATLLYHDYPRLTHPPLNLQTNELLSAVVERRAKSCGRWRRCSASHRPAAHRGGVRPRARSDLLTGSA